jgi:hypothetical protein
MQENLIRNHYITIDNEEYTTLEVVAFIFLESQWCFKINLN